MEHTPQLSEIIKSLRQRKNWTQRDLAAQLGAEQADIQRIENPGRNLKKQHQLVLDLLPLLYEQKLLDTPTELVRKTPTRGIGESTTNISNDKFHPKRYGLKIKLRSEGEGHVQSLHRSSQETAKKSRGGGKG